MSISRRCESHERVICLRTMHHRGSIHIGAFKTKLPLYASHGVPEYWMINAVTREAIHRQPSGADFETRQMPQLAPVRNGITPAVPTYGRPSRKRLRRF